MFQTLFLLADGKIVNLRKRGGQHCHVIPFLRAAAAVFIIQYEKDFILKRKNRRADHGISSFCTFGSILTPIRVRGHVAAVVV